jgi:hypothetical protein
MITRLEKEHEKTIELENKVKEGILIPVELKENLRFSKGCLGSLFLEFWSNQHKKNVIYQNSKVSFCMMIDMELRYCQYIGDVGNLEMTRNRNLPKMMGFKKATEAQKIIKRINDYINKNKEVLINSIEV